MSVAPVLRTTHVGLRYAPDLALEHLGIRVVRTWLRDTWAAWSREQRDTIVIASGLSVVQERCVLAHEIEHVLADDDACADRALAVRRERRADLEAARKLVAISDLAAVAQWAPDVQSAAHELQVTERMLTVRLNDLRGEGWPWLHQGGSKIAG